MATELNVTQAKPKSLSVRRIVLWLGGGAATVVLLYVLLEPAY